MDALELPYPVDVAAPKLVGSDNSVRTGVTIEEVEVCEPDRVYAIRSSSFPHFSSYNNKKDALSSIDASGSVSLDKISDRAVFRDGEYTSEDLESRNKKCLLFTSSPEVQLRKSLKVSKSSASNSFSSKKPRVVQLEDSLSLNGADDAKDTSDKHGSYLKKCSSQEKTQLLKQRSSLSSKRGDKRNLKVSLKTKFDSQTINARNGSAAAGSSFLGLYGLRSEVHDFTKLVDDPPLDDLLNGNYNLPRLSIDKGKKDTNVNECFLQTVRKACSVLQLPWPVHSQNIGERESCSNSKLSTNRMSPVSSMEEGVNVDVRVPSATDAPDTPSSNKVQDSCGNSEALFNALDLILYKPDDMFLKLSLPPPKDLESLLQDASKSSVSSKNATDLRSTKQQSRRAILQPFPWSHSFNGHCKANSDSSKLSASRSTCPGRWWRIEKFSSESIVSAHCFTKDLESLTFNQSLVPSTPRIVVPEDKRSISMSVNHPQCGWDSLPSASCSKALSAPVDKHLSEESRGKMSYQANDQHCPRVLAAAQTLYEIATYASTKNRDGITRWPKKPSQKSMRARKLKSEETEELYAAPMYGPWFEDRSKIDGQMFPSKKPKLGTESNRDHGQTNSRKGPSNWTTLRSSRSSPSKFIRDSISETKYSTSDIAKQSCLMPPPSALLCKAKDAKDHAHGLDKRWKGQVRLIKKLIL